MRLSAQRQARRADCRMEWGSWDVGRSKGKAAAPVRRGRGPWARASTSVESRCSAPAVRCRGRVCEAQERTPRADDAGGPQGFDSAGERAIATRRRRIFFFVPRVCEGGDRVARRAVGDWSEQVRSLAALSTRYGRLVARTRAVGGACMGYGQKQGRGSERW